MIRRAYTCVCMSVCVSACATYTPFILYPYNDYTVVQCIVVMDALSHSAHSLLDSFSVVAAVAADVILLIITYSVCDAL